METFLHRTGRSRAGRLALGILLAAGLTAGVAAPAHADITPVTPVIPPVHVSPRPVISASCGPVDLLAPGYPFTVDGKYFTPGASVTLLVTDDDSDITYGWIDSAAADGTIHFPVYVANYMINLTIVAMDPGSAFTFSNTVNNPCT